MVWKYSLATYVVPIDKIGGNDTVRLKIPDGRKLFGKAVRTSCYLFVVS